MKNGIVVLLLAVCAAGGLFAQEESAMNAITLDIGPTIAGMGLGFGAGAAAGSGRGFGIGAQYERHLTEMFSVAGRFAYMFSGIGMSVASMDMSSFSIEGHGRIYPMKNPFFLDAMAGYSNFDMKLSSSYFNDDYNMNYIKLGLKLGGKFKFGQKRSGFVFEPSVGYNFGIPLGGKQFGNGNLSEVNRLMDEYREYIPSDISSQFSQLNSFLNGNLNVLPETLANFVFVGGPRVGLSFGWAF